MIGYITLGTNDPDRAAAFYDAALEPLAVKRMQVNDRITMWSKERGAPMLAISVPFDGEPATVGNGVMVALNVGTKELVESTYTKALAAGGADEGAPGPRGGGQFYGGYFRDLDGNKIVVYYLAT
jgi:catechol 2,3-dioxygenase-like lactoylglutathione lyase family enzyme